MVMYQRKLLSDPVLAISQKAANLKAETAERLSVDHVWGTDCTECCEQCLDADDNPNQMCRVGRTLAFSARDTRLSAENWKANQEWYVRGGRERYNAGDWVAR